MSERPKRVGEVDRAGLQLLEQLHRLKVEDIRRSISVSRQSGHTVPVDEVLERLQTRIRRLEG
jgi:hypothetical protein